MKNYNTDINGNAHTNVETLHCNVSTNAANATDKFRGEYRIASTRLQTWDYARNGHYFITICTKDRQNVFGNITDGKMDLNELGNIAKEYWLEIPRHFDNAKIDEFIIMPNHVHGILVIDNGGDNVCHRNHGHNVETLQCNVSTNVTNIDTDTTDTVETTDDFYSKISPKPKSLSTMIRSYKSICTKTINKIQTKIVFEWQSGFYDHIIRDEKSLEMIRDYIINNPSIEYCKDVALVETLHCNIVETLHCNVSTTNIRDIHYAKQ